MVANVWRTVGAESPEAWLANVTGETTATAARSLTASDQLAGLPETSRLLAEGRVSQTQAALVAAGVSADPTQERNLLLTARQRDAGELGRQSRAVRQAARATQMIDRERIFRSRYLRTWTSDDGAFEGRFRLTPDHGAIVQSALSELRQAMFARARAEGRDDPADAYTADALVELARERGSTSDSSGPKALVRVRVDRTALLRGHTVAGEVCEVDGIGPVAVATARAFAEDAILEAVLTEAHRVVSVIPAGRSIPASTRRLLCERDQVCVVPGCDDDAISRSITWSHTRSEGRPQSTTWRGSARITTTRSPTTEPSSPAHTPTGPGFQRASTNPRFQTAAEHQR